VDDQPSFRGMARRVLEWRGYVVAGEADSAASAIAAAERLAPDAVLLDVCLGEDSGFDVACTLTQARPELAVLLVSSIDYRQCETLVRDCGARGFVLKSDLACVDLEDFWRPRRV
jgi:DNA-binding NarL/FixJ family response regulator